MIEFSIEVIRKKIPYDKEAGKWKGGNFQELEGKTHIKRKERPLLVVMRPGDTPVPIPNTKVKAWTAENTMLETAWEDRWLPD